MIGPPGHVFYVSPDSVYVWASSWGRRRRETDRSLFRMPLDGSGPSALGVSGSPVDQFSFLQSEDQYLNVLVQSRGKGDGMWRAEVTAGDVALDANSDHEFFGWQRGGTGVELPAVAEA